MNKNVIKKSVLFFVICICICVMFAYKSEAATSKYYIRINKRTNVATVYNSNDNKPKKAFLVSCGKATPVGTFYTKAKYRWRPLYGNCYGQYATRITGSILFHSVWYYKNNDKSTLAVKEYNKLGRLASKGCVRLNVESAKWIYDNCKLKTKVTVFNGTSKNDPLGKPKLKKITSGKRKGWDPTDPDKKNPYNKVSYKGVAKSNRTLTINNKINILKGVSATTKAGRKLTSKIKVKIKEPGAEGFKIANIKTLLLSKAGKYEIQYSVKDNKTGITKKKTIQCICKDPNPPTITGVVANQNVEYMLTKDLRANITATNSSKKNLTYNVVVYVKRPNQTTYTTCTQNTLLFDQLGMYEVKYRVVNPDNNRAVEKEVKFNCVDTKQPIITGCQDITIGKDKEFDVRYGVYAKTVSNIDLTKNISIEVTSPTGQKIMLSNNNLVPEELGIYSVKYTVVSPYGAKSEIIRKINVEEIIE